MTMLPGEKMVWAAAYALELHERGNPEFAVNFASKAVDDMRRFAEHADEDSATGVQYARDMVGL